MRNCYKRILSVMIVCIMLFSVVPVVFTDSGSSADAALPAKFRLNDSQITPVRNQGSEGLCWSFGTSATLETECINLGIYDSSMIFSPLYQAVQQMDGYEKDYAGGDYNGLRANGQLNVSGGSTDQIIYMTANGKGGIGEYMARYDEAMADYQVSEDSLSPLAVVKGIKAYNPYTDRDAIKSMLMQGHGAVFLYHASSAASVMQSQETGMYTLAMCMPNNEGMTANHAVELVGWNDTISKSSFPQGMQPTSDGAWIIKNSWGTTQAVGDTTYEVDGYWYVSYESCIDSVLFYTVVEAGSSTEHIYSYDHGYSYRSNYVRWDNASMANIFTADRDEGITGASFSLYETSGGKYPIDLAQSYKISVYKLRQGSNNPRDGTLLASAAGDVDKCGTVYAKFNGYIGLNQGDRFSVVVDFTGDRIYLPVDTYEDESGTVNHTVAHAGESFLGYRGQWTDISSDGKSNFRIKAYTDEAFDMVAEIVRNGEPVMYTDLQFAIDDAETGEIVKLLRSVNLTETVGIDNKEIVLDLRGFQISADGKKVITVTGGSVIIKNGMIYSKETGGQSEDAVTVNSSDVTLERVYLSGGGGKSGLNATDSVVYANEMMIDIRSTNSAPKAGYYITNTTLQLNGSGTCDPSDWTAAADYSTIVNSDQDDKVTINYGRFIGNFVGGKAIVNRAEFPKNAIPASDMTIGSESSCKSGTNSTKVGYKLYEYTKGGNTYRTGDISDLKDAETIKLLWNVDEADGFDFNIVTGATKVIDLNGHTMKVKSCFVLCQNMNVRITNSSEDRAKVICGYIGLVTDKFIVDRNIDIEVDKVPMLYQTDSDGSSVLNKLEFQVDPTSTLGHHEDTGSKVTLIAPGSMKSNPGDPNSNNIYVEYSVSKVYGWNDAYTIEETTDKVTVDVVNNALQADHNYSTKVTDPNGKVIRLEEKTSVSVGGIENSYTKMVNENGTVTLEMMSMDMSTGYVMQVSATKNGKAEISASATIPALSGKLDPESIPAVAAKIQEIVNDERVVSFNCTEFDYKVIILSLTTEEFYLSADTIKAMKEYRIGVSVSRLDREFEIEGKGLKNFSGDLTVSFSEPYSKDLTDKQKDSAKAGKYYLLSMVSGERVLNKLPFTVKIAIPWCGEKTGDPGFCRVGADGTVSDVRFEWVYGAVDMMTFETDSAGVFFKTDKRSDDIPKSVITGSVAVIAVLAAGILLLGLRRRP